MGLVQVLGVCVEGQEKTKSFQPNKTSHNTLTYNYTPPPELDLAPEHPFVILYQAPL